jgi:conjugal transfer mating pair stabilization protein TraG
MMEIITYSNVELLRGIMLALAHIFGSSDYAGMLAAVVLIGFCVALVAYAFQPQKLVGWYWMATVLCVSAAIVVPRTDVQIIDRLQNCGSGNCVTVVPDVPLALAALASVTSRVGDGLASIFETRFGNIAPSVAAGEAGSAGFPELNYRENGLMFGNKLVRETARATFPDPNFRFNLTMYLQGCAAPDMTDGTIDPATIRMSDDIWRDLGRGNAGSPGTGGNPARFVPNAAGTPVSCRRLGEQLDQAIDGQIRDATTMLGKRVNADNTVDNAVVHDRAEQQIGQAYLRARLGTGAADASRLVRQNAMINAMSDATGLRSQRTNDPTAMMVGLAEAQAKVSTNTSWITGAKVAEEAMPLIRNGIEAILYAAFPIIVLMMLVVTGRTAAKLLTSYAATLLWIQLWPPLFAVLNYMATAAAARHLAAAGAMPNGQSGLSLLTAASIYENSISDVAVVGYLVISVPVIAWSLVKGMEAIGAGALAGASTFTGGAHAGATQAATGNVSMGNVRTDDVRLAPHYGAANYSTFEDGFSKRTDDFSSRNLDTVSMKKSDVGVDAGFVHRRAESVSQQASQEFQAGQRDQSAMSRSLDSTVASAISLTHNASKLGTSLDSVGSAHSSGSGTQIRSRVGHIEGGGNSSSGGESTSSSASRTNTNQIGEATTGSVGVGTPGFSPIQASASETLTRGNSAQGGNAREEAMSASEIAAHAEQWQKSGTSDSTLSDMHSLVQDHRFQTAVSNGDAAANRIMAGYQEAMALKESSTRHFQEAQSLRTQAQNMRENAESYAVSFNNAIGAEIIVRGEVDQHADDLQHNVGAAGERAYDYAQPSARQMGDTRYGAGYGDQSRPVEARLEGIEDERVEGMRARHDEGRFTDDAVQEHRRQQRQDVSDQAWDKGLDADGTRRNAGGGGGPSARSQIVQQMEENSLDVANRADQIGTRAEHVREQAQDRLTHAAEEAEKTHRLKDGSDHVDPVRKAIDWATDDDKPSDRR